MTALITIFMHIITYPTESSTQNDIALMEVVVGFFGRLEFVTSGEAAFTKTGEFIRGIITQLLKDPRRSQKKTIALPPQISWNATSRSQHQTIGNDETIDSHDSSTRDRTGASATGYDTNGDSTISSSTAQRQLEVVKNVGASGAAREFQNSFSITRQSALNAGANLLFSDMDLTQQESPNDPWLGVWIPPTVIDEVTIGHMDQNWTPAIS